MMPSDGLQHEVMTRLGSVLDPEMPINIVDLGLVEAVTCRGESVAITLLPTFVGCPALDMIRDDVVTAVTAIDGVEEVEVTFVHDPPWSIDRITPQGRAALSEHGVTVPGACCGGSTVGVTQSVVPCPFCKSRSTRQQSSFGPTRCRSIWYCDGCRNTFERMKRV
jgi:ring-1,2-phenylacetyl-CoA epoxidase subunit PaaD